jgi:hypothetical protein
MLRLLNPTGHPLAALEAEVKVPSVRGTPWMIEAPENGERVWQEDRRRTINHLHHRKESAETLETRTPICRSEIVQRHEFLPSLATEQCTLSQDTTLTTSRNELMRSWAVHQDDRQICLDGPQIYPQIQEIPQDDNLHQDPIGVVQLQPTATVIQIGYLHKAVQTVGTTECIIKAINSSSQGPPVDYFQLKPRSNHRLHRRRMRTVVMCLTMWLIMEAKKAKCEKVQVARHKAAYLPNSD